MEYVHTNQGMASLTIQDKLSRNVVEEIKSKFNSFFESPHRELDLVTHLGGIPLYVSKEEALNISGVRETKEQLILSDDTRTVYTVNYDQLLQPALRIDNRNRFSPGRTKAITAELRFSDRTYSLSTLDI